MFDKYFKAHDPELNINNRLPVARAGLPFILAGAALFLVCLAADWACARNFFFVLTLFVAWFFRDPDRPTPPEGFGLAPADGRIIKIEDLGDNPHTGGPAKKISIFMNLFNVHVNRAPVSGRLTSQTYFPGTFLNASFDKASADNERNVLILETPAGPVAIVQIAGLIARRIVSWARDGDELKRGQRFGLIRFGSRVDLYLPPEAEIMVAVGQNVSAGWSPLWRDGAALGRNQA
ncbi:MAG: phosphatidylserine decarboxylase family protein [Candidatus Adiutrix sp.]|jgi:phosphatidylserine decarboxylase|nr:phosphatidylserine decarboxylase family protein [Candidatus Adiutrix sp.]